MAKNYYYIDDATAQGPNTLLAIENESARFGIGATSSLDVNGPIISRSGALVFSSLNTNSNFVDPTSVSATNVDHIWNTDANPPASYGLRGTYHFVNDSTYKSDGNSAIRAGGFYNMNDTGTASQRLQISGGAYVSGNVGIGITNPTSKLHVSGNVTVTGSVSKGSGSFVIDHPLNETKNLVHSFIEGPRADLIYRGTVSLIDGSATINLDEEYELIPGTWKALCRNPQVWISNIDGWTNCRGTVEDGILIIEAQTSSNESVNWLVIAERKDKHMYDTEWTDDNGRPILEPFKT